MKRQTHEQWEHEAGESEQYECAVCGDIVSEEKAYFDDENAFCKHCYKHHVIENEGDE